ncbi:hypothetical protein Tco_0410364 [Tanacetum coccineum]
MKLDQFAQFHFNSLTEEEGWNRIEEYVQYQDDLWDELLPSMNVSSISEAMQPTFRGSLKRVCNQISYLKKPTRVVGLKNPYLICDYCGGSHEADECRQNNPAEQVYLSGGDIYDDPSLLSIYQNDDTPQRGNSKRKEKGEDGPEWVVRSKFEDELAKFMLEKNSHKKGIREMLHQHRVSTQDPLFLTPSKSTPANHTEGATEKEGPEGAEPSIIHNEEPPLSPAIHFSPTLQVIKSVLSIQSEEAEKG